MGAGLRIKKEAKFRGQTQSQYLNFGNAEDGKAEAEATQTGSRATVCNLFKRVGKWQNVKFIFYFKMEKMEWDKLKVSQWVETVQTAIVIESPNQVG